MMIRLTTALVGIASAGTAAAFEVGAAAAPGVAFAWSALAGVAGAGVTYGMLTGKVNAAHALIKAEKLDRERADDSLKADINRGFDGLEKRLDEQTRTVIDAMARLTGQK